MLKIHMKTSELTLNMKCWSCTELMRVATIYPEMMWRVQILFIHVLSIIHDSPDVLHLCLGVFKPRSALCSMQGYHCTFEYLSTLEFFCESC